MRSIVRSLVGLSLFLAPLAARAKGDAPASAAHGPRSVMVFVGAQDRGAESSAVKLGGLVESALSRADHYTLSSLREAAGERVSADARAALHSADAALQAGQSAFDAGKLDDAEQQLKAAVKGYEQGVAGLYQIDSYSDANAYLAAVDLAKHHDDDAEDALSQALAVKPNLRLDEKLEGGPLAALMRSVRHDIAEGHKGSVSIFSAPAGGKIFVDGELKGYAPLSLDRLALGKHLVRFERAGYMNAGQVVEVVSTEDATAKGRFVPTDDFSSQVDGVTQALKEVSSAHCGPATFALIKHYNLDRAIFANVSTTGDNLVLDLSLVDGAEHARIAHRRNSFEAEDADAVNREVNHLVSSLLADAEAADRPATAKKAPDDPLDSVSGMEDWGDDSSDDAPRKKHHSDDP